ncbi:hypothetical protein CVD28_02225 [Bacillus sp. M6-12]|uniref:hypothetical protein n=1 Tax=Bacillus sp. M6-12 TaxID=2054166 RepID=UPI000C78AE36|nr:hypothetical protein [Bacillus sp. M6-12]PLS19249.1 hypothetical protein CVD28_02225 [Bacillus sp. M6-12]
MIIYYYHGTSIENAVSILSNRLLKGKKSFNKHKNRYVSFSTNKLVARQFGEVVLRFEPMEKATPVELTDFDWILENQEIAEYALSGKEEGLKMEEQIVLKNKHRFENEAVTIYLIHDDAKHLEEMKQQLAHLLKDGDKLTKNAKMYKDFQDWK